MVYKMKYVRPVTTTVKIEPESMLAGSGKCTETAAESDVSDDADGEWQPISQATAAVKGCAEDAEPAVTEDRSCTVDGHRFVDLGLPSGLLWAETNLGAVSELDPGDCYAWGETAAPFGTEGASGGMAKESFTWGTYKYGSSETCLTKYNTLDGFTALENADDAASNCWGGECRMPTDCEFKELIKYCGWTWDSANGGYRVKSRTNGNSIYLPATGYRKGRAVRNAGIEGCYWSASYCQDSYNYAYCLRFLNTGLRSSCGMRDRYCGLPIRAVAESGRRGSHCSCPA